jgi:hypothetical protein
MKKLLMITAAVTLLSGGAAFAGDVYVIPEPPAEYGTYKLKNVDIMQNPFDVGRLNQSPIRGKGAFKVVHNMPTYDDSDTEITKAIQLLQDNGYRIFKPK